MMMVLVLAFHHQIPSACIQIRYIYVCTYACIQQVQYYYVKDFLILIISIASFSTLLLIVHSSPGDPSQAGCLDVCCESNWWATTICTVKDCWVWTVPDSNTCSYRPISIPGLNTCPHHLTSAPDPYTCPHDLSPTQDPYTCLHPLSSIPDPNICPHPPSSISDPNTCPHCRSSANTISNSSCCFPGISKCRWNLEN